MKLTHCCCSSLSQPDEAIISETSPDSNSATRKPVSSDFRFLRSDETSCEVIRKSSSL